jgi:hypothetical protein
MVSDLEGARWIYLHTIDEHARHNGHAGPLREMADAPVGW